MGDVFHEIRAKEKTIKDVIRREEGAFNKTLDKGIELFEREVSRGVSTISGSFAFRLYDEQGFPLDLTELMARERGLAVDVAGFETLMEEQRARARKGQKKEEISVEEGNLKAEPTKFLGYDFLETESVIETVLWAKSPTNSISSSIERRFTLRWADKWEIADCFMCPGMTARKSVSCALLIRKNVETFLFIGQRFWKVVPRNRARQCAFQLTLTAVARFKGTIP